MVTSTTSTTITKSVEEETTLELDYGRSHRKKQQHYDDHILDEEGLLPQQQQQNAPSAPAPPNSVAPPPSPSFSAPLPPPPPPQQQPSLPPPTTKPRQRLVIRLPPPPPPLPPPTKPQPQTQPPKQAQPPSSQPPPPRQVEKEEEEGDNNTSTATIEVPVGNPPQLLSLTQISRASQIKQREQDITFLYNPPSYAWRNEVVKRIFSEPVTQELPETMRPIVGETNTTTTTTAAAERPSFEDALQRSTFHYQTAPEDLINVGMDANSGYRALGYWLYGSTAYANKIRRALNNFVIRRADQTQQLRKASRGGGRWRLIQWKKSFFEKKLPTHPNP